MIHSGNLRTTHHFHDEYYCGNANANVMRILRDCVHGHRRVGMHIYRLNSQVILELTPQKAFHVSPKTKLTFKKYYEGSKSYYLWWLNQPLDGLGKNEE